MPRTALLPAVFCVAVSLPAALAGPPRAPSGKMVRDEVTRLQAEVQRLEKEVGRDHSDPAAADELDVARARLAAAQGRTGEARAAWRKIIDSREAVMRQYQRDAPRICTPADPVILRGPVAEACCGLAEVEGDRATLVRELPKVVASYEARLRIIDLLRQKRAYESEETEEERAIRKQLRQFRQRLDAVQRPDEK